jgi:hypothetical protein
MSREPGLQTWPASAPAAFEGEADLDAISAVPVLIRVPQARRVRPARRPSARASARARQSAYAGPHHRPGPRRRLRREVRMAGYLLMTTGPLTLAAVLLAGSGELPGAPAGAPRSVSAAARRPSISLSIEPSSLSPVAQPEPPVVLPGYVLPDDPVEEPSHAGG